MYADTLRGIAGIGIYPALSLLLFLAVFATVVYRVLRMGRADERRLAALPLDSPAEAAGTPQETLR
jgi:hypothetical protein